MEKKIRTVGSEVKKIVDEYFEVYKSLASDPNLFDRAEALALHDLVMKEVIYKCAQEDLKKLIKQSKKVE